MTENERVVLCRAAAAKPQGIGAEEVSSVALMSCCEKGWLVLDSSRPAWQRWYALTYSGQLLVEQDARAVAV